MSWLGRLETRFAIHVQTLLRRAYLPLIARRADYDLYRAWRADVAADPNPLLRAGAKYFSQFDEDGILLEILRRLELSKGHFVEIGVGDGTENNSIVLLSLGWSGRWIGGEPLAFVPSGERLRFTQTFVTSANIEVLVGGGPCDVFSIDIDGNDYWIAQLALPILTPRVVVVEYNAKFPPPARFVMPYRAEHQWDGTDYFGVSLGSWADLLEPMGYRLVCCSYAGLNAFFVRTSDLDRFPDVPTDVASIYRPALYVSPVRLGHPTSPKTVEQLAQDTRATRATGGH